MNHLHNKVNREELKKKLLESAEKRLTLSFYKYYHIGNPRLFRDHLFILFDKLGVLGRIYVAKEGINAQISVPEAKKEEFVKAIHEIVFLRDLRLNYAIEDDGKSFFKLTIKVKNKIVADGLKDDAFDVTDKGVHVDAAKFNELASKEKTVILDMRNHYESEVGHFQNAITPDVETFRDSLPLIEQMLEDKKDHNLLMYCTGGIRCEKASAYYKSKGFENVYQLEGGIIEYARQVKNKNLENKFIGKNFVFDERLGERISNDVIAKCHQCGKVCDTHTNCANDACHILFIQCDECGKEYEGCCSKKCKDFINLSQEERITLKTKIEFNGTKFGKGRYKAVKKDEPLEI
ncbi:oxygen-dependent tRNA uridine(34) hydroxylase TrhO [Portibacter marinus]|uniref:oxygen-dependent tRNA uridine(34) hydroxylase TrhO n=1 Tax=Portibacter marinus TaxID=2898660 RepID=UPI001F3CDB28|nr:rhodanese-related sulfurtransferase [Portibacter marinus]